MNQALYKLWLWFWHLVPANPILVRVVYGASRRKRHLYLRAGYLAILLAVVLISLTKTSGGDTLADMAKGASTTFRWAAITQLLLMCFLAPIFTAGAITQERDSRTYNILLTTPLSNAQIVLGSLMSRLFFVIMLLIAGLPIFFATMIYGGVTAGQIMESLAIAGATAILTGALAICVSMINVGTRRTIFSFYLMIALYLCSVYALGRWDRTFVREAPLDAEQQRRMSWLAPYHPYLCLEVTLNQIPAPDIGLVAHYGPLDQYLLAYPHVAYVLTTLLAAAGLVIVSLFYVRRSDKEGEVGLVQRLRATLLRQVISERRRLRHVWANPVAWREAATRASAVSRGLLRYVIIGGGAAGAIWLLVTYLSGGAAAGWDVATTREWLSVIVMTEFGLVLLVATNTAATAITKEREANTMDLLLTTPLTSAYIVRGKLRGLVSYAVPLIAVPTGTVLLFGLADLFRGKATPVVWIESWLELALLMITFSAVACVVGLKFSLTQKKTVQAVMASVGTLVVAVLFATAIGRAILSNAHWPGAVFGPITPFTAIWFNIDPAQMYASDVQGLAREYGEIRAGGAIGTLGACIGWFLVVRGVYSNLVRNFDMTIRKQSAQI